jgi:hypothetical protein
MPVVLQLLEAWCEYHRVHFWQHHPSGASAPTACHYADPVQMVTAYKFFHPTVSGALIISGKEAVVE